MKNTVRENKFPSNLSRYNILIRWGSHKLPEKDKEFDLVLNDGPTIWENIRDGKARSRAMLIWEGLHPGDWVEKSREYRVHVVGNEVVLIYEKIPHDAGDPEWHQENCKYVVPKWWRIHYQVRRKAKKAVKALGLDFGGVDVCIDKDGHVWVFEVNTGPLLLKKSRKLYIKAWRRLIEKRLRPKPPKFRLPWGRRAPW